MCLLQNAFTLPPRAPLRPRTSAPARHEKNQNNIKTKFNNTISLRSFRALVSRHADSDRRSSSRQCFPPARRRPDPLRRYDHRRDLPPPRRPRRPFLHRRPPAHSFPQRRRLEFLPVPLRPPRAARFGSTTAARLQACLEAKGLRYRVEDLSKPERAAHVAARLAARLAAAAPPMRG